jgi:hypothetical protein
MAIIMDTLYPYSSIQRINENNIEYGEMHLEPNVGG